MAKKNTYDVTSIHWDLNGDRQAAKFLPQNDKVTVDVGDEPDHATVKEAISEYLFDKYGYDVINITFNRAAQ